MAVIASACGCDADQGQRAQRRAGDARPRRSLPRTRDARRATRQQRRQDTRGGERLGRPAVGQQRADGRRQQHARDDEARQPDEDPAHHVSRIVSRTSASRARSKSARGARSRKSSWTPSSVRTSTSMSLHRRRLRLARDLEVLGLDQPRLLGAGEVEALVARDAPLGALERLIGVEGLQREVERRRLRIARHAGLRASPPVPLAPCASLPPATVGDLPVRRMGERPARRRRAA